MSESINDKSPYPQSYAEVGEQVCIFEGHDRPRYIHPVNGVSGYLGFEDWFNYWQKPVYASEGTGTLDASKFYSIFVVPVNTNISAGGFPIYGNQTMPSVPKQPSGASKSFNFTVPVHPQKRVHLCGQASADTTGTLTDDVQSWTSNQWVGYAVKNVETGETDTVTANTSQGLSFSGSLTFSTGDRYQLLSSECTARLVYAAEMASASALGTSVFYLAGTIRDNTTTTFELKAPVSSGETFAGDMFPPPNASWCHNIGDVLYCGGGVQHRKIGTAQWVGTTQLIEASGAANSAVAVTVVDDDYTNALTARILRFTLGSALVITEAVVGSYVTITDSENTGENDIEEARILRVADDLTWFEIENNAGVANASDTTMKLTITPNYVQGTASLFTEGMVDAFFNFTDDNAGKTQVSWVDIYNDRIGLAALYKGNNTAATPFYEVVADYGLYFSDYKNPHRFRSVNVYDIGDRIIGISSIGRNALAFCSGSVWRQNTAEPGSSPQLITDRVFFDAPHSICSNGAYVAFFDGEGISITDGVAVSSVTAYKARNFLQDVNKLYAYKIQGIYNPVDKRYEFVMPLGTDTHNNYGLYISEGNYMCSPFSMVDCNALFTGYDNGSFSVYHGTSGDYSAGTGQVLIHEGATDGLTGTAFECLITGIAGQVVTVQGTAAVSWAEGSVATFYPAAGGAYRQYMVEAVTDNGGFEYELTFDAELDLTLFSTDDYCLLGIIPFDYGIKWTDFSSPQYLHRVRTIHFDLIGMTGKLYVDQYLDLNKTPVQSTSHSITPTISKVVVPFRQGYGYTHGFRLRGYSSTAFKINAFERLFESKT